MSGPAALPDPADDPALDPVVLAGSPVLEVGGWRAALGTGGTAILPWRTLHRQALAEGATAVDGQGSWPPAAEALVRIGKGRAATQADLARAWAALAPGGRFLIAGGNDVGIATWAKRIAQEIGAPGTILANRNRGRVVAFPRTSAVVAGPDPGVVPLGDGSGLDLTVPAGVFSADGLDGGTAALLAVLASPDAAPAGPPAAAPATVVDLGCGAGHLGLAAARRFPGAMVHLLDADARAVAAAAANAKALSLADRCRAAWWDAQDPWPAPADLVLCNPPAHAGTVTDLDPARRLFLVAIAGLAPGGRMLLVANRHLPYERNLAQLGCIGPVVESGGFKVITVTR